MWICHLVPADLQSAGHEPGDLQSPEYSFLHHLLHALPPVLVGDVDHVDACRQGTDVHQNPFSFAFGRGHTLPEGVEHFSLLEVFARDGDKAGGGVGVEGAESLGRILFFHRIVWHGSICVMDLYPFNIHLAEFCILPMKEVFAVDITVCPWP